MKTKKLWNREAKLLLAVFLLAALLQIGAVLLWNWCDRRFLELMMGGGDLAGDPETLKNRLRFWQMQSEKILLIGIPLLYAGLILVRFFRKCGKWTPLLALPVGFAGAWLAAALSGALHGGLLAGGLTLARSAARSAILLAAGYLILWLIKGRKQGKQERS